MNKMEKKPDNKILNPKFKAFLSLIGNILMNIVIGNSLIWLYLPETINFNMYLKPNQNITEDNPFNKTRKLILFLILTFSNVTKLIFTTYTKYLSKLYPHQMLSKLDIHYPNVHSQYLVYT